MLFILCSRRAFFPLCRHHKCPLWSQPACGFLVSSCGYSHMTLRKIVGVLAVLISLSVSFAVSVRQEAYS